MVQWRKLFSLDSNHFQDEVRRHRKLTMCSTWRELTSNAVLPSHSDDLLQSAISPAHVTKVALRLKYQIEQVIPCELEEWKVTKANSPVITHKVVRTAKEAGGKEHQACVVYCLLVCYRWFKRQAAMELWDADLLHVRATACEVLAKIMFVLPSLQALMLAPMNENSLTSPSAVLKRNKTSTTYFKKPF